MNLISSMADKDLVGFWKHKPSMDAVRLASDLPESLMTIEAGYSFTQPALESRWF